MKIQVATGNTTIWSGHTAAVVGGSPKWRDAYIIYFGYFLM